VASGLEAKSLAGEGFHLGGQVGIRPHRSRDLADPCQLKLVGKAGVLPVQRIYPTQQLNAKGNRFAVYAVATANTYRVLVRHRLLVHGVAKGN
jgi:hypothetical protein